jgi:hypothetical protein
VRGVAGKGVLPAWQDQAYMLLEPHPWFDEAGAHNVVVSLIPLKLAAGEGIAQLVGLQGEGGQGVKGDVIHHPQAAGHGSKACRSSMGHNKGCKGGREGCQGVQTMQQVWLNMSCQEMLACEATHCSWSVEGVLCCP